MEIEKNVPISNRSVLDESFPFGKMEIGDSFLADGKDSGKLRVYANAYKNRYPDWNYTTRKQPDGKVRIWRIAAVDQKFSLTSCYVVSIETD